MMDMGKQTGQFFDTFHDMYGRKKYRLKTLEQYSREHGTNEQPGKQYFKATSLPEIVNGAPMPTFKSGRQGPEMDKGRLRVLCWRFSGQKVYICSLPLCVAGCRTQ